nr:alpha-amylase family glycosyl hydrolase [uncultured Sphingomonas sp.]
MSLTQPAFAQIPLSEVRARLPQDEVIYFVMPDRFDNGDKANDQGGLKGDRLKTGYDPTAKGFFHGGDLKGLVNRLDYIQGLGATAIWLTPIFKNKPVQGPKGDESAAYHGYWITDFTSVDPHLGTNADFKAFVDAAHARGMKVYMDIIANHTADVIQPVECEGQGKCDYRSRADYPYQRKGGVKGTPLNKGFNGDADASPENWAKLTDPNYAYTVRVPKAETNVKKPDWLNDPTYYHNRGNSTFEGESSTMGDFVGLDDLATENPRVVSGLIDIYGKWIDDFGVDGFRIDTARHVNPEFWQQFVPAMLARARAKGIPNFHIFGEVADGDAGILARHTRVDKLPTNLDFAFAYAAIDAVAKGEPPAGLAKVFSLDPLYEGGAKTALQLPTFLGNHDMGRFAGWTSVKLPNAGPEEQLDRAILAHAMLLTLRGVPTIYYGDEQGFTGDGGDQDAREDMMPSKVAVYNDNKLIGTTKTTADSNFDPNHPLYMVIANLAKVRKDTPALRRGLQKLRYAAKEPGLLAMSRFDPDTGKEVLLVFNTSTSPLTQNVEVEVRSAAFSALAGQCPVTAIAPGSVQITLTPLGYAICEAK